jgi:hypothetical protein
MHEAPPNEFDAYPQPSWNTATSVNAALDGLIMVESETEAAREYEMLLNALGNNHAGTYYPVAIAVVPHLGTLLELGRPWPEYAAVEVLLDLAGSFEPEPGHELLTVPNAQDRLNVRRELLAQVRLLVPALRSLAKHDGPASRGARELIELVGAEA